MKTLMAGMALALGMSVYFTLPAAAEEKAEPKAVVLVERIQDLNLTDDQEDKIADIQKEHRPKMQAAAKELAAVVKEEVEEVQGVLTAEQKEKLQTRKEERRERRGACLAQRFARLGELDLTEGEIAKINEIRTEFRPTLEKAMKNLHGLLSDEQKQARETALKAGKRRREVLAALNLTAEQKEKAAGVFKEIGTIVREELEKIRDVLSEEQKAKLAELKSERRERVRDRRAHRIATHKDLNLTEEQREKIAAIRTKYRPKVHEAGNKLRATVREEVQAILAVLKG
jgi:Spy/CpxP family protein refolding chaperone